MRGLLLLLAPLTASALGPVVVRVGDAGVPAGLESDGRAAAALGLSAPAEAATVDVEGFTAARRALYDDADLAAALETGQRAWRGLPAPERVPDAQRAEVARGLWFVAHLLLNTEPAAREQAAAALDLSLAVDPDLVPDPAEVSPQVIALRDERMTARGGIAVRVEVPGACTPMLGGRTLSGPTTVEPGSHRVGARCDGDLSPLREIVIDEPGVVTVEPWQAHLALGPAGLRVPDAETAGDVATRLLDAGAPQVVTVEPEGDALRVRQYRPARPVRTAALAPAAVSAWLEERPSPPASTVRVSESRVRPWHYSLMGVGAVIVAGGALAHGLGYQAVDETSTGLADHRDDFGSYEIAYATLYSVGGATLLTGAILAIVAATTEDDPEEGSPEVMVMPSASGVLLHATF